MSVESLNKLRAMYPGRLGLSPEEVALVLKHSTTRGVVQRVREAMKNGRYPDARKIDGRWHIPIEVVAEIYAPTPQTSGQIVSVAAGSTPRLGGRRRSAIGPRMRFLRDALFWVSVYRAMGWDEQATALAQEWSSERQHLQDHFNAIRAERSKAHLMKELGL
ncbi:hypothetical protein [Pseudoxanthomonas mexicana]